MIVFGILKRHGKVYTAVVNNTQTRTLMPIISRKIKPDSVVYTEELGNNYLLPPEIIGKVFVWAGGCPPHLLLVCQWLNLVLTKGQYSVSFRTVWSEMTGSAR